MLRKIVQIVPKANKSCVRTCCWNPVGPVDPRTQITIMKNGMRVATEQVDSPLACVSLVVAAGSRYETACNNGLTHFIEHMAFKGFKSLNRAKLEESMIMTAGRLTSHTSREMQIFSAILPSEHALSAVDKLYKIVTDLDLSEASMEEEKRNIEVELLDIDNDPKKVVFNYLHATAYQGTPLSQCVKGTSENLGLFEPISTTAFICEHYQPYRLVLATSGNVTHDKIMSAVEPRFGALTPQPCCEPEPGPNRYSGSSVVYRDDSMPFAHVAVAVEAPGYISRDYVTMLLLKKIMGSWDKSQGWGKFEFENMCERYESFYIAYRDTGLFGTYFVADRLMVNEVVDCIQEQWVELCAVLQRSDIERGASALRVELSRNVEGVVRSSLDIGKQMLYTCGRRALGDILYQLECVKPITAQAVADKWLYDRCPVVAAVGPTEKLQPYTKIRNNQYWIGL